MKALKAVLVLEEIEFPYAHDLDVLRSLLPSKWEVLDEVSDLSELTEWAVQARYPGAWPEATQSDAARAASLTRCVYDEVTAQIA